MTANTDFLRGLVGARLANKDNWLFFIAGSKEFLVFLAHQPPPTLEGLLMIAPHPVVAGDVAGYPELWVMIGAQPKATHPVEASHERKAMAKILRVLGHKGRIRPDQDIFIIMEKGAPQWAGRLVANYVQFICTGEGAMEPRV